MIGDSSNSAYLRLYTGYNFAGYPTTFFDGGQSVLVGNYTGLNYYTTRINTCGQRVVAPLDLRTKVNWLGNDRIEVTIKIGNNVPANGTPNVPATPSGNTYTEAGTSNSYTTSSTDPDSDMLYYQFDWGDNTRSEWLGPYNSGESCSADKSWNQINDYNVTVRTKDDWGDSTSWSPLTTVTISCCLGTRGNIDGDQNDAFDISDLLYFVDFMFTAGSPGPACEAEADVNGDSALDISDLLYIVDYMFAVPPGPEPVSCQ